MDYASDNDDATLVYIDKGNSQTYRGTLKEINVKVSSLDKDLAREIKQGNIIGVISISCSVALFSETLQATAAGNLPVTGTGGTSLSLASSRYKIRLVGNSGGSVATTPVTKAISFSFALAQSWDLNYSPWNSSSASKRQRNRHLPTWTSVLNSCLPAFWAVALFKRFLLTVAPLQIFVNRDDIVFVMEEYTLPTVCAIIMAHSRRNTPGVLIGSVTAATACRRSILAGLLAGWTVPFFEEHLLYICILYGNVPATMTNLLTGGFVGAIVAAILTPVAVLLSGLSETLREYIQLMLVNREDEYEYLRIFVLSLWGVAFCYGSKIGWYHAYFLPLILLDMEVGDASFFGALDQLTLVLVSAGICSGVWVMNAAPDLSLVKRGFRINLLYGDFIEACYPFMEKHMLINFGGYLGSACSAAVLTTATKSSAYLPFPLAIWLSDDIKTFIMANILAAFLPFLATVMNFAFFVTATPVSTEKKKERNLFWLYPLVAQTKIKMKATTLFLLRCSLVIVLRSTSCPVGDTPRVYTTDAGKSGR